MLLSELAMAAGVRYSGADCDITAIHYDSRHAENGSLFCCVHGILSDGHDFAKSAVEHGASALLVERPLPLDVPQIVVENSRKAMAEMAAAFYGYPQRELRMLGVTGTNGKTTTTYMVKTIAERAGKKVGLIGTIRNMIGDEAIHTERTTPESVDLFRLLRQMADAHVDLVVMEVSSHSLAQYRVYGIRYDVALFTNLTQDHLDYHKTFDNYLAAKKMLFLSAKKAVVNVDDPYAERIMEGLNIPILKFGVSSHADILASNIDIATTGVNFDLNTPDGSTHVKLPITGLFSVYNAMGSVGMCESIGVPLKTCVEGLEAMEGVAGRIESVKSKKPIDFSVFVDYAHTPDALENVLKTVQQFCKGRVICVFGCGGDRDRAKRPIMGEIAGRFSEHVIVTSDNPRSEQPMDIISSIEEGVKKSGTPYVIVENRRDAIARAIGEARKDDVIVVAGKGHENYQEINGTKYHFDDKEIVEELLAKHS